MKIWGFEINEKREKRVVWVTYTGNDGVSCGGSRWWWQKAVAARGDDSRMVVAIG